MFKKILIAEDFQDTNTGIATTLSHKLNIPEIQEELYCDKAYNRLKLALTNKVPFQLLITDLSFKESYVDRKLTSGINLINSIKAIQPNIKVIVNSMEDNPAKIKSLFQEQKINGYVCKGRHSLTELVEAIHMVNQGQTYVSPQINMVSGNNVFELDEFDILILTELANGLSKKEIAEKFKQHNITPNSESTIDKRVSKLFDDFGAKNTTQLIALLTRDGLI
ncbi:response regulator transcription factor [Arenibacter sp. ARW7G5Y1]|uniref:response regulator transcription factor n=1 Tax=Arenibacter sp. ARW7G5Y1 TaxID=2135619 RepID=UPI000D754201|nr:response regulator transcription factor [Arenibacter sp. ARW7G5Y1]PXX26320.1 DNA-binding NarL/FixJ family response regulator [Arenibacter sp. ARW7G5Y1]